MICEECLQVCAVSFILLIVFSYKPTVLVFTKSSSLMCSLMDYVFGVENRNLCQAQVTEVSVLCLLLEGLESQILHTGL